MRGLGGLKEKRAALRRLIDSEDVRNALIFCNRKRDVGVVHRSLERHGYDAGLLHGDLAQSQRTEVLGTFKRGDLRLLVCSDVAARGLDIDDMSHVFNFDVPTNPEDYVHRIGRTGRAGRSGRAFTIAVAEDGKYVGADREPDRHADPPHHPRRASPAPSWKRTIGRRRRAGRGPGDQGPGRRGRDAGALRDTLAAERASTERHADRADRPAIGRRATPQPPQPAQPAQPREAAQRPERRRPRQRTIDPVERLRGGRAARRSRARRARTPISRWSAWAITCRRSCCATCRSARRPELNLSRCDARR